MNVFAQIKVETSPTAGGDAIIVTQDSDQIALISKEYALQLADEIRELANTLWTDNPQPLEPKMHDGYNSVPDRRCD